MMGLPVQLPFAIRLSLEPRKHMVPYSGLDPAIEAGSDTLPGSVLLWELAPGRPSAIYPQDGLYHGAMILGGSACFRRLWRQKRSYALPLLVGQDLSCHLLSLTAFENRP